MRERSPARAAVLGGAVGAALGLALGAVVAGAGPGRPGTPEPVPSVASSPAPAACLRLADRAERVADLGEEAALAMRGLDARRLEGVVSEMAEADLAVREALAACRAQEQAGATPDAATPTGP